MKLKKIVALLQAMAICFTMTACGNGKINISVGGWPEKTDKESFTKINNVKEKFEEENPEIKVNGDKWIYDTKSFPGKAKAGRLPTVFNTWLAEMPMIIENEYAEDITDIVMQTGYYDAINPELWKLVSDENGRIYGIPNQAYAYGLCINKRVFREAGLVEADGVTPRVPKTYDELAEFAGIIKKKTGKIGLAFPTVNNCGGMQFTNIAWSYGVNFVDFKNGKWMSQFDTPNAREALRYIKDLKWKYNALSDGDVVTEEDAHRMLGSYQAGMIFAVPPTNLSQMYGMAIDDIYFTSLPSGPCGSYAFTGGDLYVFKKDAAKEEIRAAIKWLEYNGFTQDITDDTVEKSRAEYANKKDSGAVVLYRDDFPFWTSAARKEKIDTVRGEYVNTKPENFESYFKFDGVTLHSEPEECAQQLYSILDGIIQEVVTNENANVDRLISTASKDYQKNNLDEVN